MKVLASNIDTSSASFLERQKANMDLVGTLRSKLESVSLGGPAAAREKYLSRGKLLVRDRINLLLDPNTPFLELSPLAANEQYDNQFPSAGIVTGIGMIHEKEVIVVANDATVKGGTYIKETIKKHLRAQEVALQNQLPCVYLVDSGGVFLSHQS